MENSSRNREKSAALGLKINFLLNIFTQSNLRYISKFLDSLKGAHLESVDSNLKGYGGCSAHNYRSGYHRACSWF